MGGETRGRQIYIWVSLVAQMVKNLPGMQEAWFQSLGRENLLEKGMATREYSVFLPGEFHGLYIYMYGCVPSLFTRNYHSIVC